MKKRVLITPMDWGLGHASRCVKIIRKLNEYGYEVIIGCDNKPLHFLKKEFAKSITLTKPLLHPIL